MQTKLLSRLNLWRRRSPWQFWQAAIIVLALVGSAVAAIAAKTYEASGKLDYRPCQIDYGRSVSAWDGNSEEAWNQSGWHYEARLFKMEAHAPAGFWQNWREQPPSRLVTSSPNVNEKSCAVDFNGLIDLDLDLYQWYGAKPVGVRLGAPNLGELNRQGEFDIETSKQRTGAALTPPLSAESHRRAAAWVDDSARVVVESDQGKTFELWCQDNSKDENCTPDVNSEPNQRGEGYLFAGDNCPEHFDCNQVTSWYRGFSKLVAEDFTGRVGRNQRGELLPFYLHQEAVSHYGYSIGAYTVLTFKYPKTPEVTADLTVDPAKADPGGNFSFNLSLNKIGPDISSLTIKTDLDGQPLAETAGFEVSTEALAKINANKSAQITASYKLGGGQAGKCYSATINLAALSITGESLTIPPLSARYCIRSPILASYSYDVMTRGNVEADFDEFVEQAAETLGSKLGWAGAGVRFTRVDNGGDFTLVLASSDQMSTFSSGCSYEWSCQAGRYVIINEGRWRGGTSSWNSSGLGLRNYRHMVVNHEVGHWLGFGHLNCPAAGAKAPVMQQQSISLQGCKANPWPTLSELAALKSRL